MLSCLVIYELTRSGNFIIEGSTSLKIVSKAPLIAQTGYVSNISKIVKVKTSEGDIIIPTVNIHQGVLSLDVGDGKNKSIIISICIVDNIDAQELNDKTSNNSFIKTESFDFKMFQTVDIYLNYDNDINFEPINAIARNTNDKFNIILNSKTEPIAIINKNSIADQMFSHLKEIKNKSIIITTSDIYLAITIGLKQKRWPLFLVIEQDNYETFSVYENKVFNYLDLFKSIGVSGIVSRVKSSDVIKAAQEKGLVSCYH